MDMTNPKDLVQCIYLLPLVRSDQDLIENPTRTIFVRIGRLVARAQFLFVFIFGNFQLVILEHSIDNLLYIIEGWVRSGFFLKKVERYVPLLLYTNGPSTVDLCSI